MTGSHQTILYSFRRCPYAMRARLALFTANIAVQLREINLRDKHPTFLQTSPKGTVPVLILPNNTIIDESLDIVDYVCTNNVELKSNNQEQYQFWLEHLNSHFRPACHRIKYPDRFDNIDLDKEHMRCKNYCETLNNTLKLQPFLHGDTLGQADFVIFPFIRQLYRVDEDILFKYDTPDTIDWLQRIMNTPIYEKVMKKHDFWT